MLFCLTSYMYSVCALLRKMFINVVMPTISIHGIGSIYRESYMTLL